MRGRLLTAGAVAAGLVGVATTPAVAAQPEPFEITCNGVTHTITSGNGEWAVGQSVDKDFHGIPYAFSFTGFDESGNVLFQESIQKGGNAHQNQDRKATCTFNDTFEEEGQMFFVEGVVEVILRP